MVNQLAKFLPHPSEINKPPRDLTRKETVWSWGTPQQAAFEKIKDMLCSPAVLAHYDPKLHTIVATNAAAEGVGAVLLQVQKSGE